MMDPLSLREVEQALIGELLITSGTVGAVATKLSPEDFSDKVLGDLYSFIRKLYLSDVSIDELSVVAESGIAAYKQVTHDCIQSCSLSTRKSPDYYCDLIIRESRMRQVNRLGYDIAYAENLDTTNKALDELNGLMVTRHKVDVLSAAEAVKAFYTRQDEDKPAYLPWGIADLDRELYTEPGDFVVIGGYPSAGKTLLSLQFAIKQAERYRVGYYSLETNVTKLSDRLIAHAAQIPLSRIKRHELTDAEWNTMVPAVECLQKLTLECIGAGGMSVQDIRAMALSRRHQIIFVDYLQLVTARGKDRYEEVTNISKDLHKLAQTNGITVIALAQLSRPDKTSGKPQPPTMSSFRESGQIEQDADIALLLWPEDPNNNRSNRVLKVAKNKEGEKLRLELSFNGATQTLTPVQPSLQEELRKVNAENKQADQQRMEFTVLPQAAAKGMPF